MRLVYVSAALMVLIVSSTAAYGCGGSGEDPCVTMCRGTFMCSGGEDAAGITCADFCAAARANNPAQCRDKIDAFFACAAEETYTCTSSGLTVTPAGGCAVEGQACAACTGKVLCYIDLSF